MENQLRRTWAEIDLDRLADNYHKLRARMGEKSRFLGVVKADAYGHGAVHVARKLEQLGAEYLAVSNVEEAEELRRAGVGLPLLLLGYTPAEMTPALIANGVTQDVPSLEMARAYSQAAGRCGGTLRVHLKLDTGMGRLGFQCDEAHFQQSLSEILEAMRLPHLDWEGVFMHFCVADEPGKPESVAFTHTQYQRFTRMIEEVERRSGITFAIHHCDNSGGVAYYPQYAWDMCRPGILLYGTEKMSAELGLQPVMTLKSVMGPIKEYEDGTSVSYGRTYYAQGRRRLGVVPVGYADGLFRCLSNRWSVMTAQGAASIRGRICMDMCMVDLTELPDVKMGDEVVVFGGTNPVEGMAAAAGTISYELLCAVSKRVPRAYLEQGKLVAWELPGRR
jgi:alanine racemase